MLKLQFSSFGLKIDGCNVLVYDGDLALAPVWIVFKFLLHVVSDELGDIDVYHDEQRTVIVTFAPT